MAGGCREASIQKEREAGPCVIGDRNVTGAFRAVAVPLEIAHGRFELGSHRREFPGSVVAHVGMRELGELPELRLQFLDRTDVPAPDPADEPIGHDLEPP